MSKSSAAIAPWWVVGLVLGSVACSADGSSASSGAAGNAGAAQVAFGAGGGAAAGASSAAGNAGTAAGSGGSSGASSAGGASAGSGGAGGDGCHFDPDPWPNGAFVTSVVSFTPGPGAGFGQDMMPCVAEGPPHGQGTMQGSLDVVSLGMGGEIVLGFAPNAIVDGPGVDFIVFENAFYVGGDPNVVYADPGEISVSDDGTTWTSFPCPDADWKAVGRQCAGVHPVISSAEVGVSPFDPTVAGGDQYDLADLGVAHARYVKIKSRATGAAGPAAGFDLDAIAIVHAKPD